MYQCCKVEQLPHHPKVENLSPERRNMKHDPYHPKPLLLLQAVLQVFFAKKMPISALLNSCVPMLQSRTVTLHLKVVSLSPERINMKHDPYHPKQLLLLQAVLQAVLQQMLVSALLNSHVPMLQSRTVASSS